MRDFGQWPQYTPECRRDVDALLKKGGSLSAYRANKDYGAGPAKDSWAWRLEREIERKFGVKHAVAVNSGTAGLHCAIHGTLGRPRSGADEVITSPYTFSATASAILHAGYKPVFCDVDSETFCITADTVKKAVTKRTAAILPVDLFGRIADTKPMRAFEVPIISDACQAVGANLKGLYSGAGADAGVYSFNGGKNVPAGEGGALVTNSDKIAEKARLLGNHACNFGTDWVGYNYRPNEVTCCIAWHGLRELKERNDARIDLAHTLKVETVMRLDIGEDRDKYVVLPHIMPGGHKAHAFYVFPFTVHGIDRAKFIKQLVEKGIPASGGYITPPLHHYKAFRKYAKGPLPVVDELSFKTLCLLSHVRPPANEEDMIYTAKCIEEALR